MVFIKNKNKLNLLDSIKWSSQFPQPKDNKNTEPFVLIKILSNDEQSQSYTVIALDSQNNQINESFTLKSTDIYPINEHFEQGINDMVDMENLNEAELLYNLKIRFEKNIIFSYVGPTLIAINPYMKINELFSEDVLIDFQKKSCENDFDLKNMNPHVYAICGKVFRQLIENNKNQAIVISGESGAGKTEETKYAMNFLTSICKK